jgi:hypothetical protein
MTKRKILSCEQQRKKNFLLLCEILFLLYLLIIKKNDFFFFEKALILLQFFSCVGSNSHLIDEAKDVEFSIEIKGKLKESRFELLPHFYIYILKNVTPKN